MRAWKTAALAAALLAVALGAAYTPVVQGQTRVVTTPRAIDVFSAGGSQIGVSIRDAQGADAQAGVVVEDVTQDGPAEKAGIKKGDVFVEFDGERVRSARQLTRLVQETPVGRKVQASVMRDGQKVNVTVEPRDGSGFRIFGDNMRALEDLGRWKMLPAPPAPPARPSVPTPPAPPAPPMFPDIESFVWRFGGTLGFTVGDLPAQLAEYFGAREGALVTSVAEDSAAAKAGVKAGDVITSVDGASVGDPSDLRRRIQRLETGEEFTLGIVRDKKSITLKGKVEERRNRRTVRTAYLGTV